jgi:hypothetical protein
MKYLYLLIFFLNFNLSAQDKNFESINNDNALFGFVLNQKMSEIPNGYEGYKDRWVRNLIPKKTMFCGYEVESIYLRIKRKKLTNIKFYLKNVELNNLPELKKDCLSILGPCSKIVGYQIDKSCDHSVVDWVGTNIHLSIFVTKDYPELEKCSIVITATSSTRFMRRLAGIE